MSAFVYGAALIPVILLFGRKLQFLVAVLMAGLAVGYPILKGADIVPQEALLQAAAIVDEDRANSLRFRFEQESVLLDRASEKPLFGWGIWARNHILDEETGEILTVADGRWIIRIGMFGWVGFLSEFLLLAAPIFMMWRRARGESAESLSPLAGPIAIILAVNMIDLIPNATLTPLTWLVAGAMLGYARYQSRAPGRRVQSPAPERRVTLQTVL